MLTNGDRVLVCLSGGKDSLSLLHTLHQYQYYVKAKVRKTAPSNQYRLVVEVLC